MNSNMDKESEHNTSFDTFGRAVNVNGSPVSSRAARVLPVKSSSRILSHTGQVPMMQGTTEVN